MSHTPKPGESSTIDELAGHCFGCGPRNPQGLHLAFTINAATLTAHADFQLTDLHQGAPGFIHGGIIATLLDEAASKLNRPLGVLAMTRHLDVDYLRPAPLQIQLRISSRHLRREGRKLFHESTLATPDGTVLATGKVLFIVIPDELLPPHIRGHFVPPKTTSPDPLPPLAPPAKLLD